MTTFRGLEPSAHSRRIQSDQAERSVREILDLWQRRRRGRTCPLRAEMPPEDLRPFLGWICLYQVLVDPVRFLTRLDGSAIVDLNRQDNTGRLVDELRPSCYAEMVKRDLARAHARSQPLVHACTVRGRVTWRYQRVILPLSSEGRAPDLLMTYSHIEGKRAAPAT